MNATSLYVSTCRLVVQANADDQASWNDLYRLLPYLRQALSCTVCNLLLVEPYSPDSTCQHHVCKSCKGKKKRLKPSCSWCKCYDNYTENVQLRILLQCYKRLNEYLASTEIFRKLMAISTGEGANALLEIVEEGAGFKDEFHCSSGLSMSALKQLPCVIQPSTTVNVQTQTNTVILVGKKTTQPAADVPIVPTNSSLSVISNKDICNVNDSTIPEKKKLKVRHPKKKENRTGCRCGNATSAPGKLTCCGQRCPCYVEAKACLDCRCRGCRNPHLPSGKKVTNRNLAGIDDLANHAIANSATTFVTDLSTLPYLINGNSMYSTSAVPLLEQVPSTLLVDDERSSSEKSESVDVDV